MSIRSLFHKIFYIEETKETVKMREMLKALHEKKHVVYVDDIALEKDNLFIVHGENARGEIVEATTHVRLASREKFRRLQQARRAGSSARLFSRFGK